MLKAMKDNECYNCFYLYLRAKMKTRSSMLELEKGIKGARKRTRFDPDAYLSGPSCSKAG